MNAVRADSIHGRVAARTSSLRRKALRCAALLLASGSLATLCRAQCVLEFKAPDSVVLGEAIVLQLEVKNTGPADIVVREPRLDARSFEFLVQFGDNRASRYTAYTPSSAQPSTLVGQDLKAGDVLDFEHALPALKAGTWTFTAVWNGGDERLESPPKVIRVEPKDGAEEMLLELKTGAGTIRASFWPEVAPATALHVAGLARSGFYDGVTFHRVIRNFMIQTGDPTGTGAGGPGYTIQAEFGDRTHEPGVLSMARGQDPGEQFGAKPSDRYANTAGSQFFIMHGANRSLDGRYSAFGKVMEGQDVVDAIATAPPATNAEGEETDRPAQPVTIQKAGLILGKHAT